MHRISKQRRKQATRKRKVKTKTYTAEHFNTLRFNILKRLHAYDEIKRANIVDTVAKDSDRNESTVRRLIQQKKGDTRNADFIILDAFAKAFNVTIEQLLNR